MSKLTLLVTICATTLLTAACSPTTTVSELEAWKKEQEALVEPRKYPVKEPFKFIAYDYKGIGLASPFNSEKLLSTLRIGSDALPECMRIEMQRVLDPLEYFALSSMKMVGSVQQNNRAVAMIQIDDMIYPVTIGERLGQNYGKIVGISESEVSISEKVLADDKCIERPEILRLHEAVQP